MTGPFVTKCRDDDEVYIDLAEDAPEWLRDAVREAHDGLFPDDRIYRLAARAWEEGGYDADDAAAFADGCVDVYVGDLLGWAAHPARLAAAEAAIQDGQCLSIESAIRDAQFEEAERVFCVIRAAMIEREEEEES